MIKVYKSEKYGYVCELWAASTKHPDSIFHFSDFEKVEYFDDEVQVYQWLLECASKLTFPFYAKELADYAAKEWYKWQFTIDIF